MRALLRADPPDHTGAGNLDKRTIAGRDELCGGVRLSEIPYRTVIDDVGAPVRAELDVRRAVEACNPVGERLLEGGVVGKALDLEGERLVAFGIKVDQLDLVSHFGRGCGGIPLREPEIPFKAVECGTILDRPSDKRLGHEVDPRERRVRRLDG